MKSYEPHRPRTAIALAAAALTAITLGLFVVAPAKFDAADPEGRMTLAIAKRAAPIEVAISPARIDVVGVRERNIASTQPGQSVVTPLAIR